MKARALTEVGNDGTYPHLEIGKTVAREGDLGYLRESWSFLGELYYTVEFTGRAVVVIMLARELAKAEARPIAA